MLEKPKQQDPLQQLTLTMPTAETAETERYYFRY
jgi:hypothetical protein